MQPVLLYDTDMKELEQIAMANDATVAEVVASLLEYAEEMKKDNNWV